MYCGQSQANLTSEHLLVISPPMTLIQECLWVVNSEPGHVIYVDLLNIEIWRPFNFRLGVGPDLGSPWGTLVYVWFDNATLINGTSYFFREPSFWILYSFMPPFHGWSIPSLTMQILLRSESGTGEGKLHYFDRIDDNCIV